jgi:outer membrane receptor protein involved in Fe transport
MAMSARLAAAGVAAKAGRAKISSGAPTTAGYGLVDLFASYAYNDRVSANFSVNNLLNMEYTQFLNVEPNPGMTVKGGITIKFAEK